MNSWKVINLGDAATFVNGYAFKPADWSDRGNEIIRIQNLTKSSKEVNYFEGQIAERYKVSKGDLLISWSATLGVYEWEGDDAWLNQHIFKVVFDKEEFDKNFFRYLISDSLDSLGQEVHGATMKHITKKKFDAFKIPLPPLPTQKKIAAILDAADAHRQKTKQLLTKYDELAQSIFLEMFGDPVTNPKGWEVVATIRHSKCIVPGRDKPKSFSGDTPWITTGDLNHLGYTLNSRLQIGLSDFEINQVRARLIPKESVIMTCVGDLGVVSITKENIVMNQQLHAFICNDQLNNVFLMHNLSHQTPYMYKMASSTTVPYMNKTVANNTPTILPPIELQNQFAEKVKMIDSQKEKAEKSFRMADSLFSSLLQKAFNGELGE